MNTIAKQKVVGIHKAVGFNVSKESLSICHLVDGKVLHLETENNQASYKQLVRVDIQC